MSQQIFAGGRVRITASSAQFDAVTYPLPNIGSVCLATPATPPRHTGLYFGGLFSAIIIVGIVYPSFFLTLALAAAMFGGWFFMPNGPREAILTLRTSSGDVQAFKSHDVDMVQKVHAAVLAAIAQRS
jgi:hypothetical protein